MKLALDHRRHQRLDQRDTGTAEQRGHQQHRALAHQPAGQAGQQDHHQAQGDATPLSKLRFNAHAYQCHQAHAHHGQAGEQGAALEAQTGGQANLAEQRADGAENRPQIKAQDHQQPPAGEGFIQGHAGFSTGDTAWSWPRRAGAVERRSWRPLWAGWRVKYGQWARYSEIKYNHANQWQTQW
jgi:hypothetical protein